MNQKAAVVSFWMAVYIVVGSFYAVSEENHQHSNDCRSEPTRDKVL